MWSPNIQNRSPSPGPGGAAAPLPRSRSPARGQCPRGAPPAPAPWKPHTGVPTSDPVHVGRHFCPPGERTSTINCGGCNKLLKTGKGQLRNSYEVRGERVRERERACVRACEAGGNVSEPPSSRIHGRLYNTVNSRTHARLTALRACAHAGTRTRASSRRSSLCPPPTPTQPPRR